MTSNKTTPDERFLLKLYQTALERGDLEAEIDYRGIARAIGQKETAMKNIIKHLAQANFVKKTGEYTLRLTVRGCQFALENL